MFQKKYLVVTTVFLLFFLWTGNLLAAGGSTNNVKMVVEVDKDSSLSRVEASYSLRITEGTGQIPLTSLLVSDTAVRQAEAYLDGERLEVDLDQSGSPLLTGNINLPAGTQGEALDLRLEYVVENSVDYDEQSFLLETPLLVVNWKPAVTTPDVFTVQARIDDDVSIEESFPSTPRTVDKEGGSTTVSLKLQTIPSMVRFAGRVGKPVFLTYGRKVDLLVLLILIVGGYFGWQALKKSGSKAKSS